MNTRIADLTVTGLVYALLLVAPFPYGSVEGWPLAIVELLALFAVLIWVIKMITEGELALVRTPLGLPCLLFVGVLFLQLALGNSALRNWALSPSSEAQLPAIFFSGSLAPASTRQALGLFLTYAAVYFLVVNHFRERLQIDRLVRFLLVLGSLLAFYGLLEYLSGGRGVFGWQKLGSVGRVAGTFVNPDHFAAWLAMLIPLALGYLLSTKLLRRQRRRQSATTTLSLRDYWITDEESAIAVKKFEPHHLGHRVWQELLLFFAITIMTVTLVFTLSRGGVVSLLLSLLALVGILLVRQTARRSHLLIAALVLLTLTYAAWIGLDPIIERFGLAYSGFQSRMIQYWASLPMLGMAPLFGTGLGSYGDLFPRFQPIELAPGTFRFTAAHNDHLQFWIETGLAGGLVLLIALWRIGRDLIGAHLFGRGHCFYRQADTDDSYRRDPYNVGIAMGALSGVVAIFFHSFLDFSLRIPANGILLATLLGIATVALHNRFFRNITQNLVTVWRYPIAGRFRQAPASVFVAGLALIAVFYIVRPPLAETRFQSAVAFIESRPAAAAMTTSMVQRLENERQALELLGRVISVSPEHLAARRLRASKLEQQASRAWNRAIGPDARILKTQEERAKTALALLGQAEDDYRRALTNAPYEAALHERLAWLLGTRALIEAQSKDKAPAAVETRRRLALTHFDRAVSLDPNNPGRHRMLALFAFSQSRLPSPSKQTRATGLAAVRKAVELNPELLPELLDRALAVTLDRGDMQALVPATAVDHLHLATLLDKKGLRLQADENYQKALALASPAEKPIYHRLYANALIRAKRLPEALSQLESTVGLDPENPDIYLSMAEVHSAMGENTGALVNFQTALMLAKQSRNGKAAVAKGLVPDSDGLPPHRRLFVKLVQNELGQPDSSVSTSRTYRVNFGLARYYTKRGQFSQAIPMWEALLEENSADAAARFQLALALDGAGAWQAASNAYKQAIELDKRNNEYKAQFAQRLFENEKFFHAIELWQAILAQEPADLTTRLRLANAYVRVGQLRDAVREYERVLQLYPAHREAREALTALRGRLLGS